MIRNDFTLFFSMPLEETDWSNLAKSGVSQVMIPWGVLTEAQAKRLVDMGIRVVLRLSDEDTRLSIVRLHDRKTRILPVLGVNLTGIILGCEPETGLNWTWGGQWREDEAWDHQTNLRRLMTIFSDLNVPLVSPGWSQRGWSEMDPPEPGLYSWREICTPTYNSCYANGVHIYQPSYSSQLDEVRLLLQVRKWSEIRHREIWIDELGINQGDEAHRVDCYLRLARMLLTPLGNRVRMLCPFVSNGVPDSWPKEYLIQDPASYEKIGEFMKGK